MVILSTLPRGQIICRTGQTVKPNIKVHPLFNVSKLFQVLDCSRFLNNARALAAENKLTSC